MGKLIFVKLGGSIITDKLQAATARPDMIERLACEVRAARQAQPDLDILLGHGSGSFGHIVGRQYHIREGIPQDGDWRGYAETSAAAARLNRIVIDLFLQVGVPVVSMQPSASAHCWSGELESMAVYPIREALRHRLVPLVYGDVAFDEEQGCTIVSTENVLSYLASELRPERIVLVGEVDGVYERDPIAYPEARRVPRITPDSLAHIGAQLGGSHGVDVTGGMSSKVREMAALVAEGFTERVHIISGRHEGALTSTLLDPDAPGGTVIVR